MTTKDYLIAARAKIADVSDWTQHALARDVYGSDKPRDHPLSDDTHWEGINGRDIQACQWCAMGAVQAVTPVEHEQDAWGALDRAAAKIYHAPISISEVNDEAGHASVLACFDQAIKDAANAANAARVAGHPA
jgi:hypothetical protein